MYDADNTNFGIGFAIIREKSVSLQRKLIIEDNEYNKENRM